MTSLLLLRHHISSVSKQFLLNPIRCTNLTPVHNVLRGPAKPELTKSNDICPSNPELGHHQQNSHLTETQARVLTAHAQEKLVLGGALLHVAMEPYASYLELFCSSLRPLPPQYP
jgi:hypothetical protein